MYSISILINYVFDLDFDKLCIRFRFYYVLKLKIINYLSINISNVLV